MRKFALVAIEIPPGIEPEDVMQSVIEEMCDVELSDLTIIKESEVPSGTYKLEWELEWVEEPE